ncbi:hypothetical protein CPB86DRAFT_786994 [Serendipita vermifera]|nr:hypothetical protein CPB86DRAFT_786994 [Serendipita vermifera]
MFKQKSRPKNQRKQDTTAEEDEQPQEYTPQPEGQGAPNEANTQQLSLEDLMALRNLRKARQGIDSSKLAMGEPKKRKREGEGEEEEEPQYGLRHMESKQTDSLDSEGAKARRSVRANNFTQQTNALDVDKHMMAYIEENMKSLKEKQQNKSEETGTKAPERTEEGMLKFGDKYKTHGVELKEGSVTNSLAMLTAIPEVDLGMDARLRNIEETEKAKRAAAEEKQARAANRADADEARLAATRFYNPHLRQESDEALMKQAKLQAMGLPAPDKNQRRNSDRPELATDEAVMERFRKRMKR